MVGRDHQGHAPGDESRQPATDRLDLRDPPARDVCAGRSTGTPLRNGILWLDERSRRQLDTLDRQFGNDALHALTGRPPSMTQSLPKLVWLAEHEPDVIRDAARIIDVHAFLVHRLSGNWATSLASADPMGLVDMDRGVWATDLIRDIGLRAEQFVTIESPGALSVLSPRDASLLTGLVAQTPIVAGAGDGQAASLGAGVTGPGRAFVNLGTAVAGGALSDRYVTDRAYRTCFGPIPGTFVLESVLRGGTATVSWFMDHFADPRLQDEAFDVYEREAAGLRPGADGLVLVPYWNNVMNPYWDPAATGLVIGWTTAHRRHHLYRAILDGIAFEHRLAMEDCHLNGNPADGARHPGRWLALLALASDHGGRSRRPGPAGALGRRDQPRRRRARRLGAGWFPPPRTRRER